MQKSSMPSKFSMSDFSGEQSLAKRARRLRDSWSFRSTFQPIRVLLTSRNVSE